MIIRRGFGHLTANNKQMSSDQEVEGEEEREDNIGSDFQDNVGVDSFEFCGQLEPPLIPEDGNLPEAVCRRFRAQRGKIRKEYREYMMAAQLRYLLLSYNCLAPFLKATSKLTVLHEARMQHRQAQNQRSSRQADPLMKVKEYLCESPPYVTNAKLRGYQIVGVNYMIDKFDRGTGMILADEMGLGKTIQTLSFLAYLKNERNVSGPHLIVVPASVSYNWVRELQRFTPSLTYFRLCGGLQERNSILAKHSVELASYDVCITTYEMLVAESDYFESVKWITATFDEAQRGKGAHTGLSQGMANECSFSVIPGIFVFGTVICWLFWTLSWLV